MPNDLEFRDMLALGAIIVSLISAVMVSRNGRAATSVNAANVDLARIRDLRSEVTETKNDLIATRNELKDTRRDLDHCREQVAELSRQLQTANRDAGQAWLELAELRRLAHRPDMTIERLREYVGTLPDERPTP